MMQWDAIIAVGDVYRKGAFPRFLPNPGVALECFKVAARCLDGKIAGVGQEKYIEVNTDSIPAVDQAGGELPTEYGERICELALAAIGVLPYSALATPRDTKIGARDAAILRERKHGAQVRAVDKDVVQSGPISPIGGPPRGRLRMHVRQRKERRSGANVPPGAGGPFARFSTSQHGNNGGSK